MTNAMAPPSATYPVPMISDSVPSLKNQSTNAPNASNPKTASLVLPASVIFGSDSRSFTSTSTAAPPKALKIR